MPQETSHWNRRELKRERSESVARWRRSPSYQGEPRFFPRASDPRRHAGHGKQGGWHPYLEEPGRRHVPSRSFSYTTVMPGDGKHSRAYRDNRSSGRGGPWETSRRSLSIIPKPYDNDDFLRDQHDKRSGANRWSPSKKVEEKSLLESVDWKPREWTHPVSFSSRGSGLRHSRDPKIASCSMERNDRSQSKTAISDQSSSKKVVDVVLSSDQSDRRTSKKKPRLGWGEGLAKYENKNIEQPVGSLSERRLGYNQLFCLDAADRTSGVVRLLDSLSPATSSSPALNALSDIMEKSLETMKVNGHTDNLSGLPVFGSQSACQGFSVDMEKPDVTSIGLALVQLLQSSDISLGSGFSASTASEKLQHMKDDVVNAMLKVDYEIDFHSKELKSIASESGVVPASSLSSSFTFKYYGRCSMEQDDIITSASPRPAPLQIVSPEDIHLKKQDADQSAVVYESLGKEAVTPIEQVKLPGDAESKLCDLILSSNNELARKASSELFNNLLPRNHGTPNVGEIGNLALWQDDPGMRERFTQRKRFLVFKERVLALKFKAFHHLWLKDMRVLSLRNSRLKTSKKLESGLQVQFGGCQKPRSSICPRVFSAGVTSLMLNKEIMHFTSKLLTDSPWKIYSKLLKMPALILDEREKTLSRFISRNGLVEDPCAVEKERTMINPWTAEEREIFLAKLGKYGKDFRRIASCLDHKTTADCVEFYYKNHKSEPFQGVKKNLDTWPQRKSISAKTFMLTSGKTRNREINAVSLSSLGEASLLASQDHAGTSNGELDGEVCQGRYFLRPCSSSKSTRINTLDDESEAIAADVLTEMRSNPARAESCQEKDLSEWTDEEKSIFMQCVSRYGKDFARISKYLKTRSKDQYRAFYNKARKSLGLDVMLPARAEKPLKGEVNAGHHDVDGPLAVRISPAICEGNSVADNNQDSSISVKVETADAIDCGSSTYQKESANGSGAMGNQVSVEKGSSISLKSHEVDLNEQVGDQSLQATERWSAHLSANTRPCSVFSLSRELKNQSPIDTERVEKPPLSVITDSASSQCAEVVTHNCNHQPECREQSSHEAEGNMHNLQELESPSAGGDFKLFGKRILTHMPSQKKPDLEKQVEDKEGIPEGTLSLTGSSNRGGSASVLKFDPDCHAGLENIPITGYGYWDGTRVQTVPSLSDSAFLFAKYPAAFSRHPLQEVAVAGKLKFSNPKGDSVIPCWDITLRKRHDAYSEMQRRNGLEAISGIKQQGGNAMDAGARGALVGGSCKEFSDPVVAIEMQYALNQFWGQGVNLTRGDSWRDAADMKT